MTTPDSKITPEEESPEVNEENQDPENEDDWDLKMGAVQGTPITSGGDG